MTAVRSFVLLVAFSLMAWPALAQPLGAFRWNVAPYCSVLTLNVTQQGAIFTMDGFEDQCGGAPRLPAVGIAVPQADGTVLIGFTTVTEDGDPLHTRATISPATISGSWEDDAGNSGTFVFNPATTTGGPRPGPAATTIPSAFTFQPDGGWVARGQEGVGTIPATGAGARAMWFPAKGAFRAGEVLGTQWDTANVGQYSVALGYNTRATGYASVSLGNETLASGGSAVALGYSNIASGGTSVALGSFATASSSSAFAVGTNTTASGAFSTAMARFASTAGHLGSFVYGDGSTTTTLTANADNQFKVRASGGVLFYTSTNLSTGCEIQSGTGSLFCSGTITGSSDRTRKRDIAPLDGDEVLAKLVGLPVTTWSFIDDPSVRHAGPMAQDFHAAFGLGANDTSISYTDINGINMRAIQALTAQLAALRERIAQLEAQQR